MLISISNNNYHGKQFHISLSHKAKVDAYNNNNNNN